MRFLQVSGCCGCTDLRTGGLIIAYLTLSLCVLSVLLGFHWLHIVPDLFTAIPLLFGIHNNSPAWMLPAVVFSIFCLLLGLLNLIITIPLCYFVFWDQTKEYFIEFFEDELKKTMGQRKIDTPETIIMISIWMGIAVAIATHWYATAVVFSSYKFVKNENERTSNARHDVSGRKV